MKTFDNEKIILNMPSQIINMGGPWVGQLYYGKFEIAKSILIDNLVFSKERDKIFFIEYHEMSNWQSDNFFTISSFDISGNLCKYDHKFKIIYIDFIDSIGNLFYFESFHNNVVDKRRMKNLIGLNSKCFLIDGFQI